MRRQNKTKRLLGWLVILAMLLSVLAGCGTSSDGAADVPLQLAIVGGQADNSRRLPLTGETMEALLSELCRAGGSLTVVTNEGQPRVLDDQSVSPPPADRSSSKQEQIIAAEVHQLLAWLEYEAVASSEELDVLKAIQLAGRSLSDREGAKLLCVVSTGMSTSGIIDFRNNLLRADPASAADGVEAAGELPMLAGVRVIWLGLGDSAQEISAAERENLRAIWETLLLRSGASEVTFSAELPGEILEGLPHVSQVPSSMPEALHLDDALSAPIILDSETVRFVGDSDELVDPAAARGVLQPVADWLAAHPSEAILLVGTTASGTEMGTKTLSEQRAARIRDTLISMGAQPDRLVTMGLGFHDPWHVDDLNADGSLNANAAANRNVVIISADSEQARALLGAGR